MRYVKYMPFNSLKTASRNKREIATAYEYGFDVFVFSDDKETDITNVESSKCTLLFDGVFPLTKNIPKYRRIPIVIANFYRVIKRTRKIEADVFSCHDLKALAIAYYSTRRKKRNVQLIYDSHEFELGRNAKRNRLQKTIIKQIEGSLIKKCAFTIVVNDSIADELVKIYKLTNKPVVLMSTPNKWKINENTCKEIRRKITAESGVEEKFTLMYHGGITRGRGIETLISVLPKCNDVRAIILGNGEEKYLAELSSMVKANNVEDRVIFHNAVPISELWKYVGASDVGMILAPAICKNHFYSLPNKFFENIQSETPIICPNYPAMKSIVDRYNIGLMCNPEDYNELCECINIMRTNKKTYSTFKKNLKKAKEELCWENEKNKLFEAYNLYINKGI